MRRLNRISGCALLARVLCAAIVGNGIAALVHDADTIGAVAGQIAGTVWGLSAIPDRWVERLYDGSRIKQLTRDLYAAGQ